MSSRERHNPERVATIMPVLILVGLLAAILWGTIFVRRYGLSRLLPLLLLAGTVCGPNFFAVNGPIQISLDRLLWAGMVGLYGFYVFRHLHDAKPLTRGDLLLMVWVGFVLFSALTGGAVGKGENPLSRWIFVILLPSGAYWVGRQLTAQTTDQRFLLWSTLLLGVYLAITAVCENRGWHSLVFPRYIVDPKFVEFFGRGRGPLLNPVGNGIIMTLSLMSALVMLPKHGRLGRVVLLGIVAVLGVGILSTFTRSVWMSAAASVGLLLWYYATKAQRLVALALVGTLGATAVMGLGDSLLALKRDKNLSAADAADSVKLRPLLAIVAVEMFKAKPLAGHGYGHYFGHHADYLHNRAWGMPIARVKPYVQHNVFLAHLVDCGAMGLAMLLLLLCWWTLQSYRVIADATLSLESKQVAWLSVAMIACYMINGLFHDVSLVEMMNMYMFTLAGQVCATQIPQRARQSFDRRRSAVPAVTFMQPTAVPVAIGRQS